MKDLKYNIELTVITPLAVGAGNDNEWTRGIDFVQKDGKVYILDIAKIAAIGVDVNRLTELFLKSDEKGICQLLNNQLENVSKYIFQSPAPTLNSIKTFLRTQLYNKPLVAGSSLKGAIRSALFKSLRTNEKKNNDVFGEMKDGTDFMRFIRLSDIEMPSTHLVNTKLFNLKKEGKEYTGGWKKAMNETNIDYSSTGFNTLYECVTPEQKGYGSIGMAGNAYNLLLQYSPDFINISHQEQKQMIMETGIQSIFHIVNSATRSYLLKEKSFFNKYTAERSNEVSECIDWLLSMIPSDDSYCLMKMSAGVGFHSITGDWQFEDYNDTGVWEEGRHQGKKKYKSRKIAEYDGKLQLMGFVKIRMMSDEEYVHATAAQDTEHQTLLNNILIPIKEQEESRKAAEASAIRQQKERKEEKSKKVAYLALIEQAKQYFMNDSWDEAIAKANEALLIFPNESSPVQIIENSEKAKLLKTFAEQEAAATANRFSKPLAEVLKGIVSIGNLLGTTTKWLKMGNHELDTPEYEAILNCVKTLPVKEQRNMMKKRNDFVKVLGEEKTRRLFESVK